VGIDLDEAIGKGVQMATLHPEDLPEEDVKRPDRVRVHQFQNWRRIG
jgi:hypothetical protein